MLIHDVQITLDALTKLERAIHLTFSGSAEHGSFLRPSTIQIEYIPNVFMTLEDLRKTLMRIKNSVSI